MQGVGVLHPPNGPSPLCAGTLDNFGSRGKLERKLRTQHALETAQGWSLRQGKQELQSWEAGVGGGTEASSSLLPQAQPCAST